MSLPLALALLTSRLNREERTAIGRCHRPTPSWFDGGPISEGYQQCYNAQTVVEGEDQLVVEAEVTDNASDQGQLIPMVDAAAACGWTPKEVLADAGYGNEQDLRELEGRGIDGYVALAREGRAPARVDPEEYPARARMADKLATETGRRRYARREWQAEAPIGWIKEALGSPSRHIHCASVAQAPRPDTAPVASALHRSAEPILRERRAPPPGPRSAASSTATH